MFETLKLLIGVLTTSVVAGGIYSIKWNFNYILPLSVAVGGVSAVVLGATLTIAIHIKISPPHKVTINASKKVIALQTLLSTIDPGCASSHSIKQRIVVSRKIDSAINDFLDCFINTKILPWYSELVHDASPSINTLKNAFWFSVAALHDRLVKVDHVRFVLCGVVTCLTQHFEKIRLAEASGDAKGERGVFHLAPQMSSPVRERNFLRLVAELFIVKILPPEYHKCTALRNVIKELIAFKLLEPLIDHICNPEWINMQLVQYLRQQQVAEELGRRTYHYAASYEDFINLIHDSTDMNDLKHLRMNIINEIMQATAINNLKKAKGLDINKETTPQSTGKGDLLQARNLKRYINQLTYAKAQCERRISQLTSKSPSSSLDSKLPLPDVLFSQEGLDKSPLEGASKLNQSLQNLPGRKILMFQVLLDSAFARRYFAIYLDEIGQGSLLSFWSAVQELRQAEKRLHYQLGMEIYHTYLAPHPPPIKVDKLFLRGVEAFLLGNRGPEVLFEIAEEVERNLEDRHYTGFLVSSTYHAMLSQAQAQGIDFMSIVPDDANGEKLLGENGNCEALESLSLQLNDHSTYARNKLAHLQERLTNKLLALQAISQTKKADPKVIHHLESEIANLRTDHQQLEGHIERTWLWSDNIGFWRVYVQNIQATQDKEIITLVLFVHLQSDTWKLSSVPEEAQDVPSSSSIPCNGWVVVRKLSQLTDLHRKLCQITSSIKSMELPTNPTKMLFNKQMDKSQLEKIRSISQNYFDVVTTDDKLNGSELLYAFLSPSPEHLKQILGPAKKSKFSFSTLFKSHDGKGECDVEEIGNLIMMEHESVAESDAKDSIVEPLFAFLEELCELRSVGKWMRKTLVSFVQVTYGKNITRYVRESVQGLLSESMITYYLNTLRTSLWPEEEIGSPADEIRSPEEALRLRNEAQDLFVRNMPELLCTLVGQQNAKKGAARMFCTLQHHALNKNLLYTVFEVALKELFPELQAKLSKSA